MSMISVVIAFTIAAILALFVGNYVSNNFKSQLRMEYQSDVQSLGIFILRRMNCTATFPTQRTACLADDPIAVASNDTANPVLIKPVQFKTKRPRIEHTNLGRISLRARCVNDVTSGSTYNKKLVIEYAIITKDGDFTGDAQTGKARAWKDLFEGLPTPCLVN